MNCSILIASFTLSREEIPWETAHVLLCDSRFRLRPGAGRADMSHTLTELVGIPGRYIFSRFSFSGAWADFARMILGAPLHRPEGVDLRGIDVGRMMEDVGKLCPGEGEPPLLDFLIASNIRMCCRAHPGCLVHLRGVFDTSSERTKG